MLLSYHHNVALYNIKSLKDGRNEQCYKLFDSVVSNTAHKLHHLLPPKNIGRYNFRDQRNFTLPKMHTNRSQHIYCIYVQSVDLLYVVFFFYTYFYKCEYNLKFL